MLVLLNRTVPLGPRGLATVPVTVAVQLVLVASTSVAGEHTTVVCVARLGVSTATPYGPAALVKSGTTPLPSRFALPM